MWDIVGLYLVSGRPPNSRPDRLGGLFDFPSPKPTRFGTLAGVGLPCLELPSVSQFPCVEWPRAALALMVTDEKRQQVMDVKERGETQGSPSANPQVNGPVFSWESEQKTSDAR